MREHNSGVDRLVLIQQQDENLERVKYWPASGEYLNILSS